MKITIGKRVSLAIGLLLFLFFVTTGASFLLTKRIEDGVERLARVDDPREAAVLEMKVRLAEMARSVSAYAFDRQASDEESWRGAAADFERSAANFAGLAAADEEKRLGGEVRERLAELRELGSEIIATTDREYAELVPLRARTEKIRHSAEAKINQPMDRRDSRATGKLKAAFGMGANIDKTIGAHETYLASGDPKARDNARGFEGDFYRWAARYKEAGLTGEEQASLDGIKADFAAITQAGNGVMDIADRKRELLTAFETQRQRTDALLGGEISSLIRAAQARAKRNLDLSTTTAILYLIMMTGFGVVVGGGAAVMLTKGIVRPIHELKAGADAIGRGLLEHRVRVESDDEIGQLATSINRMAESRQRAEEALRELAHHDQLTNLANRNLFNRRLVEAMDNARRINRMVAVHILDLDHFKDVNDTLGHPSGDMLLKLVAERLKRCGRVTDTVARLGGDEFAVVQTNLAEYDGIPILAKRMIDALAKPFDLGGETVHTGASIGVTVYPHDGAESEQLLKNADIALYRAKQEGRNNYRLFGPEMNDEIHARKALEQDLRRALEDGQLFLNYQPQLELSSGRVVGAEALVRWRHPEKGMISPALFIPVAERARLITGMTEDILRDACRQAKAWQAAGMPRIRVSVNLSAADFNRKDLVPTVTGILEETGLDPTCLELEITEGMVMSGAESVIATLTELHALGLDLAIDDFGTGFSSMNYLKQFPVDRLKIDQAFVRDVLSNKEDAGITKAIIELGHSLGLKVIAEGVETEEALEFLREKGCDEIQGYCLSGPLGPDDFAEFMNNRVAQEAREPTADALAAIATEQG